MAKSARVRAADVRAVFLLAGECRELGDDPVLWRGHLLAGLGRLAGGGFAVAGEVGDGLRSSRHDLRATDWGADNGFDRDGRPRMWDTFQQDAFSNLIVNAYVARLPAAAGACLSRADLIPDRDWYRSFYYQGLQRTLGADATLACLRPAPGAHGDYSEFYVPRSVGEPDFSARQKALVGEAVAAVAPLVGGPLAQFADPSPAALPPATRRVLRCLLEGDTDKQAAARLGLTRHTVNYHAKRVSAHFGVSSRAELLARWVRRGWGARCGWAADGA